MSIGGVLLFHTSFSGKREDREEEITRLASNLSKTDDDASSSRYRHWRLIAGM